MDVSNIITKLENKNGIYINKKSPFKADLDFDQSKFKTGDEKIYVKDSITGKRFYVLLLKLDSDDIGNMIRMDIKMDNHTYTEIIKILCHKLTYRTNGFIIQSTENFDNINNKIIIDKNIGLVPEDETYVCISEISNDTEYGFVSPTPQFWTTKKLIEQIEKDASDYSGTFTF